MPKAVKRGFKRGQGSGAGAAVLIAVITALIVLYILFLPPAEREALLDEENGGNGGATEIRGNSTILLETPGRIDYLEKKEIEHALPSVNLVTTTKAVVVESKGSLYVKNGWFDKLSKNMTFSVEDLENTDNVKLSFNVDEYSGRLVIVFNGEEVFNSEVKSQTVAPIPLKKSLLKEKNTILVSVSGVGLKFWKTNEYMLSNVQVTADFTDISGREARLPFLVTNSEKSNLDRVFVKFFPSCDEKKAAPLDIYLNNQKIFSSVPDCGILRPLEVSPHNILSGENSLVFSTERGPYLIDNILVKSELKEVLSPTYYFEINESIYEDIRDNNLDIKLYLEFPDDVEQKKAEMWINGHLRGLDTRDMDYDLNMDALVKEGNNVIEIKPKAALDIVTLRVILEEKED